MSDDHPDPWRDSLERLLVIERHGTLLGVEIAKPKPWPPAAVMLDLHARGESLEVIAKKTGASIPTVKRTLVTRDEHPRTGPQCERHTGRLFAVREALSEMPLPCGPGCVCSWRPVFRFDRDPKAGT